MAVVLRGGHHILPPAPPLLHLHLLEGGEGNAVGNNRVEDQDPTPKRKKTCLDPDPIEENGYGLDLIELNPFSVSFNINDINMKDLNILDILTYS